MQAPRQPPVQVSGREPHAAGPASLFVAGDELAPVLVLWIDSMQQDGWGRYDEKVSLDCATIGHLYMETEEVVVIALSRSAQVYGGYITIPKVAVKSVVRLLRPPETCLRKRRAPRR